MSILKFNKQLSSQVANTVKRVSKNIENVATGGIGGRVNLHKALVKEDSPFVRKDYKNPFIKEK